MIDYKGDRFTELRDNKLWVQSFESHPSTDTIPGTPREKYTPVIFTLDECADSVITIREPLGILSFSLQENLICYTIPNHIRAMFQVLTTHTRLNLLI